MKNKKRVYYYYDETKDDFANLDIKTRKVPDNWNYVPRNMFYNIFKTLTYYVICFPIVFLTQIIIQRGRTKNKKCLRAMRWHKKGYFVYSNHTTMISDCFSVPVLSFPRSTYIVAHPNAISIKGIRPLVKALGALPVPVSTRNYVNFLKGVERAINQGSVISIYPEAHIWPKYNQIRKFANTSFYYPVKLNAPCYVKTTIYKKKRNGKSKMVNYLDGPFYPDIQLGKKEAQQDLRDRVYQTMCHRVKETKSYLDKRYSYIKVNSQDEVKIIVSRH